MISKKSMLRQRLRPRLWHPHYFAARSHLNSFQFLCKQLKGTSPKILDIGCGYCPFKKLVEYSEYVGVDFDKNASDADIFLDCGAERMPYGDEYFEVVIISETLEHVYQTDFLLDEAMRILKPGGYLFVSTPFMFCEHGVPYDYRRFTKYFYKRFFDNSGIILIKTSNSFLSAPLLVFNQVVEHLPLSVLRLPIYVCNNLLALAIEGFASFISRFLNEKQKAGLDFGYEGISVIYKKK